MKYTVIWNTVRAGDTLTNTTPVLDMYLLQPAEYPSSALSCWIHTYSYILHTILYLCVVAYTLSDRKKINFVYSSLEILYLGNSKAVISSSKELSTSINTSSCRTWWRNFRLWFENGSSKGKFSDAALRIQRYFVLRQPGVEIPAIPNIVK